MLRNSSSDGSAPAGSVLVHKADRFSAVALVERNPSSWARKASTTASAALSALVGKPSVYTVFGYCV